MNRKRWANSFDADTQQDNDRIVQKWDPEDYDADLFDSDKQNMSLTVVIKLANQLSLLKQFLEIYKQFNVHLGRKHNLFATVVP